MFKLNPNPTFQADIVIPTPDDKESKISFVFKHKGRKAMKGLMEALTDGDDKKEDVEILLDLIEDWKGVDAPFNKENLELLLDNYHGSAMAIFNGYAQALVEGRRKN